MKTAYELSCITWRQMKDGDLYDRWKRLEELPDNMDNILQFEIQFDLEKYIRNERPELWEKIKGVVEKR